MGYEIKVLKLTSGEFLIAKILLETADMYRLYKPIFINISQQGLSFADILGIFSDDEEVDIDKQQVTFELDPIKELLEAYQEKIGNIITPKSKLIV